MTARWPPAKISPKPPGNKPTLDKSKEPDKCVKTAHKEQNGTVVEMTSSTVPLYFIMFLSYLQHKGRNQRANSADVYLRLKVKLQPIAVIKHQH